MISAQTPLAFVARENRFPVFRIVLQRKTWLFELKRRTAGERSVLSARERLPSKGTSMQDLSPRHVKTEESLRLGVVSGWYSTKVSGTFVSGPHATQEDCLSKIAELNPPAARKKF